jgi:hypothetical protein
VSAERRAHPLVPEPPATQAMREAADKAIWDLGGYQSVADRLHSSADFLRKLRASRRRADLADLVALIGRVRAADNRRSAGAKPGISPQPAGAAAPAAPPLLPAPDPAAIAMVAASRRVAVIVGLPQLARCLGLTAERLAARLAGPDPELALLIEAVVIPDFPDLHRPTT